MIVHGFGKATVLPNSPPQENPTISKITHQQLSSSKNYNSNFDEYFYFDDDWHLIYFDPH